MGHLTTDKDQYDEDRAALYVSGACFLIKKLVVLALSSDRFNRLLSAGPESKFIVDNLTTNLRDLDQDIVD